MPAKPNTNITHAMTMRAYGNASGAAGDNLGRGGVGGGSGSLTAAAVARTTPDMTNVMLD